MLFSNVVQVLNKSNLQTMDLFKHKMQYQSNAFFSSNLLVAEGQFVPVCWWIYLLCFLENASVRSFVNHKLIENPIL